MSHKHLFRHPVGYFPARARWYLAGASMAALLLVAAHLAVQVHTQDVAQATVNQWVRQSGGTVEQVRFHLLRNALTLDGVHLEAGGVSVDIPEVLLYGRVDTLLGGHPVLSRVSMSSPRLTLPAAAALPLLASRAGAGDAVFDQIWRMARHLEIHGGILVLTAGGPTGRSGTFDDLNLRIAPGPAGRTVQGTCRYRGALLTLHSHVRSQQGGASGEMDVRWDRLDGHYAAPEMLGLGPLDGEVSGRAQWSWQRPASGPDRARLQGEMRVVSGARVVGDAVVVPSLSWHAEQAPAGWHVRLSAEAWPLAPMRTVAPAWADRELVHGAFSGDAEADWAGPGQGLARLRVAHGTIRDLDYAPVAWAGDARMRPDWHVDDVEMTDARLDASTHTLAFGHLGLAGGEVRVLPGRAQAVRPGSAWHVEAKAVDVDRLALALVFADGRSPLRTLPLSGHGSLLAGALRCDLAASVAPVSWKITGQGRTPTGGGTRLDVKATGLSLIQLRAVLPFAQPARAGAAVQLDGSAGFALSIDVNPDAWTASGKVEASNVTVAWQGVSWRAAHISANLNQVGTGVPVQSIGRLQVEDWQYQGALQPLTAAENPAVGEGRASLPFRRDVDWRIDAMDWQGGTVSFGRADAVWARDVDLQLQGWQSGQLATLSLTGDLDGGQLQVAGRIGRVDDMLRADVKGGVSSARPFFLNAWLQISGAPRVIRGRWASRFSWRTDAHGLGHGRLRLWLHRWRLETGVFPHDPFLGRTGFAAHDLLYRLQADHLTVLDVDDDPAKPGFAWADLGDAMLATLAQRANDAVGHGKPPAPARLRAEARIRLHGKAGLSHNERVRLRKLWRWLIHDPHLVLDMVPQMERQDLDADLVATIRHTQDMIARFMTDRGIPRRRLFPVWPTRADRGRGSLGVRVEVLRP